MSVIIALVQWRGAFSPPSEGRDRLFLCYALSSPSVDAVEVSGVTRPTKVARTVAIGVGRFVNLKVYCICLQ